MRFDSDEIRSNGVTGFATLENRGVVEVLVEIAAQLADINAALRADQMKVGKFAVVSDEVKLAALNRLTAAIDRLAPPEEAE